VLLCQDFVGFDSDEPSEDWFNVSLMSDANWELDTIDGQQGAFINGFGTDEASDDWLISPSIAFADDEQGLLSLDLNRFFSGGTFEILASNNYDPASNDPSTATWVPLSGDLTQDDWSRLTDLPIFVRGDVRIAFHYTSTGTGAGDGQRIGVDQIQVTKGSALPAGDGLLNADFVGTPDDPISAPWTTVSVMSDAVWTIQERDGREGAFMNGFGADAASEDWLISPAIDLSGDIIPVLSFSHYVRFGGPDLLLLVSTDYDPSSQSDPNMVTWTDLKFDFSGTPENAWIDYTSISLDAFDGASTYIAFHYISNGAAGGDGRFTGIDSVSVEAVDALPELVVEATASPTDLLAGETVNFSASASGGAGTYTYTYAWDFGDGEVSAEADVSHAYADAQQTTATLTVTNGANEMTSMTFEINVAFGGDLLLGATFSGDDDSPIPAPWVTVSLLSAADWQIDSTGGQQGALANGFGADEASDDWLISPPFAFASQTPFAFASQTPFAFASQTTLAFDYYQRLDGPALEVLIGADYQPDVDPSAVHWSPVTVDLAAAPDSEWSRLGGIDLGAFAGRQCRLAFRYTTLGNEGGESKSIGINAIRIQSIIPDMPAPETFTFDEWNAWNGYFKAGDPNGAADAEPDGDGLSNAKEHRFDLNPRSGTSFQNLPKIVEQDGAFVLTYTRISDDAAWMVQLSSDLENWADAVEGQDIDTIIQKNEAFGEVLETVGASLKGE
jgi:PKD repeat protein